MAAVPSGEGLSAREEGQDGWDQEWEQSKPHDQNEELAGSSTVDLPSSNELTILRRIGWLVQIR